jgi:uncharacterized membrane protein YbhN (UPF0104 family)
LPELKRPRYLIFSIDTEPDDPTWKGPGPGAVTHENLRALPALCGRMRELGVKPTFLCSHSVARHDQFPDSVEPLLREGLGEIGAHLHPGDTPPFGAWDAQAGDNLARMPDEALEEKFSRLHECLTGRFGPMTSYRSAAWSIDARLASMLVRHKYHVDSSVTPGVSWSWIRRPSYLEAPNRAYYLDPSHPSRPGESKLLEVPVSIWIPRRWEGTLAQRLGGHLFTMPMAARLGLLARGIRAVRPPPPLWLRPAFMDLEGMKKVAGLMAEEEYLHVMCHSNEFWPGTSPYVSTREDVDRVLGRLEGFLRYALGEGYIPVTLSAYGAIVAAAAHDRPEERHTVEIGSAAGPRRTAAATSPGKWKGPWAVAGKAAVSVAALGLTLRLVDLDYMRTLLGKASPWLALACLGAIFVDIYLSAFKLSLLATPARVAPARIYRFNLIKSLFNNLLPGGVGGEAARVMCLGREIGSVSEAASLVVWDRMSGLWAQILFSVLSVPLWLTADFLPHFRFWFCAAGIAAAALLAVLLAPPAGAIEWMLARAPGPVGNFYVDKAARFAARWNAVSGHPGRLLKLMALSVLGQLSMILILCLAAAALGGRISFWQASPILLGGALSSLIPFTLGGLGVMEAAFALGFSLMGSQHELGFLAALLIRAVCLVPALLGWFVMVREEILPFGVNS